MSKVWRGLLISGVLVCNACGVARLYDGERDRDELARISGDFRVTAGAPVTVILRQVDGRTLSAGQRRVDVLPGEHQLLVDCRILETSSTSRHVLDVEVYAGRTYHFVAETSPGLRDCTSVSLRESE